jgi:hypothetical protein
MMKPAGWKFPESICSRALPFDLDPLPDCDCKTANRKTKHDDGNAGAHPSKKRALIGEMIASDVGVAVGRGLRIVRRCFRHKFPKVSRVL